MIYYKNLDKNSKYYMQELSAGEEIICFYLNMLGYKKVKESQNLKLTKEFEEMVLDNAEWYLEHNGWKSYEDEEEYDDEPEYEIGYSKRTGRSKKFYCCE